VPVLNHYATDLSGTLTPEQVTQLDQLLRSFDRSNVDASCGPDGFLRWRETRSKTTLSVSREANKIGKKGKDNGALLLVSKNDRKARIEVGYGLEGAITDALSGQIIRQDDRPPVPSG